MAASIDSPRESIEAQPRRIDSSSGTAVGPDQASRPPQSVEGSSAHGRHQRFVLSDPVAFSYLEEDPSTTVLERSRDLEGYQIYVVEQWACSRTHPTFVITAFTGDSSHSIKVGVLSVPANEESWSPRLRVYFKTLAQSHAKRLNTALGALLVTNLSTFPSSLTLVLVPDGNLRKHREDFFVAEDLKRLGCSGRVGLSISPPTIPTQAKFHQLYRVSDKIDFYSSVVELVKLCQAALMLFGCLGPEYCDGLLCDVTERAVNDWWLRIGTDLYSVEPSDGVLGHTTVSGLLGTLMGARNRLHAFGSPVGKDVFDVESTKKAISHFQRAQNLTRSRRLDRATLDRLHKATVKQASGDGWMVPRAVKSTMAELSGKGGEMVMEMVGKADRTSIAEVETTDIDRFTQLVKGERAKWLWHGKARKRTTRDLLESERPSADRRIKRIDTTKDSPGAEIGPFRDSHARQPTTLPSRNEDGARNSMELGPYDPSKEPRETTFNRAKGRLIGAVGMRGHQRDQTRDVSVIDLARKKSFETLASVSEQQGSPRESVEHSRRGREASVATSQIRPSLNDPASNSKTLGLPSYEPGSPREQPPELGAPFESTNDISASGPNTDSAPSRSSTVSMVDEIEHVHLDNQRSTPHIGHLLRRTRSVDLRPVPRERHVNVSYWPRQLSFSVAENIDHTSDTSEDTHKHDTAEAGTKTAVRAELLRAERARQLRSRIAVIEASDAQRVTSTVTELEVLDTTSAQDVEQLHAIYYPRRDEYRTLQDASREVVAEQRTRLQQGVKDVEALGAQLEYEIGALKGKVEDVEEAVGEFEKQVKYTEGRVEDLVGSTRQRKGAWFGWFGMLSEPRRVADMTGKGP